MSYAAIIAFICGILLQQPSTSSVGKSVANFKLQKIDGGFMTNADLKGKVAVVDLFATWCGPCVSEIPRYNELYQAYQGKDVAMIGVVVESPGHNIAAKVRQLGIKYPVLLGDGEGLSVFGAVEAFPTTVVIDQEGKIYKSYRGAGRDKVAKIKQDIERLLSTN